MDKAKELLGEAAARIDLLTAGLPARIEIASLSLLSKLPFKALSYRESALWRCEELARSAHASFASGDVVAGIVLTRAFTETVAGIWYLLELVSRQLDNGIESDLDDKLMRLLLGHKGEDGFPEAVNVLTLVGRMDKQVPGVLRTYNSMSEYAHPNWSGTAFAYSAIDRDKMVVDLGRSSPRRRAHDVVGLSCLTASLALLEFAYNKLAEVFPSFIAACETDLAAQNKANGSDQPTCG
jgi:hypothetical protein